MLLDVKGLRKSYPGGDGPVPVLRGVDLSVRGGETLALTGESGSGKSTFLHLVAGLDRADAGSIWLDGEEVADLDDRGRARLRRGTVGIVFQQFNLIPSLDVAGNIAFQARLAGRDDPGRVADLAARLGLEDQMAKYPEDLSGGQQQRVAIARVLAARPKLVLADEPTGNLDEATAERVMEVMTALVAETGAALLVVTHSERLAAGLSRRVHLARGVVS
ncbi:ABC transporter ATP-binding protein [Wenxinia saemankumensis]|uniref:Putative ABC transport system ATP-binding protein n=1 Tax=Wenxinia saemankumensis TaxID=1447782 RepID=A0A1M6ELK3_9RHOB|nr:ABC transporter ATP-binding protein [Wenxinia saemankumensis]SHI86412.1 putative ABC transport system ATP-binding protein [Wenxinia saemankumensis]